MAHILAIHVDYSLRGFTEEMNNPIPGVRLVSKQRAAYDSKN